MDKIIIGMSGASGSIYGVRLLELLRDVPVETHLVISPAAGQTLALETDTTLADVKALADVTYGFNNIAAAISSGSFKTKGMIIAPCAVKTAAGIAACYSDNLLLRAADVVLKDRRRLVLLFRETPLHLGHLRILTQVTEMGAIVAPALPAFYHRPKTIDDIVNQTVNRVLDLVDIELDKDLFKRWETPS